MRTPVTPLAVLCLLAAPAAAQGDRAPAASPEEIGAAAYLLHAQISCARGDADAPRSALAAAFAHARPGGPDPVPPDGIRRAFDAFLADGACGSLAGAPPDDHRRFLDAPGDSARARGEISGLASLLWGAPVYAIVQTHGTPTGQEVDAEAGILVLHYAGREILDRTADLYFVVHRSDGLIGGGYTVPLGLEADCDRTFDRFAEELRERYSRLRPAVERYSHNHALLFCHALRFGRAAARARWADPGHDATLHLELGKADLHLLYATGRYDAIREWQRQRGRWRAF
jgi:hypothetical protein